MARPQPFSVFFALSFALQLGFLIAVPIGLFLFFGNWLDQLFSTGPLFLLIGLILSLVLTCYEVYHSVMMLLDRS